MDILVDVDDTVCELMETWLMLYNQQYDDTLKKSDIIDWDISQFVKKDCGKKIYNFINNQKVYDIIPPVKDSLESIRVLKKMGHRIIFVTWAMEYAMGAKYRWLKDNCYLDSPNNYIECKDKSLIHADIMFDDNYNYVRGFKGKAVLFRKPWNMKYEWDASVNKWTDFVEFVSCYSTRKKHSFLCGETPNYLPCGVK
jgi:5'-nucleotidase